MGWEEAMQPTQRASPDIAQLYSTVRTIGADGSCTHHAAEMLHGGTAQSYRSRSKGRLSAQLSPSGRATTSHSAGAAGDRHHLLTYRGTGR